MKRKTKRILYFIFLVLLVAGYAFYTLKPEAAAQVQQTVLSTASDLQNTVTESVNQILGGGSADGSSAGTTSAQTTAASATHTDSETLVLADDIQIPVCPAMTGAGVESGHEYRNFDGYYAICYREEYEQPEWAAYTLTPEKLVKNASRADNFRADPQISTGSATLADYKSSGYDRGHLAPAADFAYDATAMDESFFLSNMSPQAGSFNRGIWAKLEAAVRDWAENTLVTYIVTGPVLDKAAAEYSSIGSNNVSVPEYYYKALLFVYGADQPLPEAPAGTLIPAVTGDGQNVMVYGVGFLLANEKSSDELSSFVVSIDELEQRTGLDFFSLLPDSLEDTLETSSVYAW